MPSVAIAAFSIHVVCDAAIDHMKSVSVRDLRHDFPKVERLLRERKDVQVTKRKRVMARLVPEPVSA